MAKFGIVGTDGNLGEERFNDFDAAMVEAQQDSENSPDEDIWVVEIKAKVISELKTDIITDENKW